MITAIEPVITRRLTERPAWKDLQIHSHHILPEHTSMEIAIIGASGSVGSRLFNEALDRGHFVTGASRNAGQAERAHLEWVDANASDSVEWASVIANQDPVVSSVGFRQVRPRDLITAVRRSGVRRYLVVGGAGNPQSRAELSTLRNSSWAGPKRRHQI